MKKKLDLPIRQLSLLKSVHINFDMTGKHYQDLATFDGSSPELIIHSILSDLVDENADLLTKQESIYLFTLVKISNLGTTLPISVECPHCHKKFNDVIDLTKVQIKEPSKNWKVKKINWVSNGIEMEYSVLPPPLSLELQLLDWMSVYRDISRDMIYSDKDKTVQYVMYMNMLHLVHSNGSRLIQNLDDFNKMDDYLQENTYVSVAQLHTLCDEVDSYGIQPMAMNIKCKECGGNLIFHCPILYGLCSSNKR